MMNLRDFSLYVKQGMGMPLGVNSRPGSLNLSNSDQKIFEYVESITSFLTCDAQKDLFYFLLLSSALSSPATNMHLRLLSGIIDISRFNIGLEWEQILSMKWMSIPLALACHGQGRVVHAFLGQGEPLESMFSTDINDFMDEESKQAVLRAAKLADCARPKKDVPGFFFWFPSIYGIRITGKSIGLAVYTGLKMLRDSLKWPELVCTGNLDANGKLSAVTYVPEKMAAAQEAGYKGMIFPETREISFPEYIDVEPMPVSDAGMALCLIKTFSPGNGATHLHFLHSLDKLEANLDLMLGSDFEMLKYLEEKDFLLSVRVRELARKKHLFFSELAQKLEMKVKLPSTDQNKIHFVLEKIFPEEIVKSIYSQSPKNFMSICFTHVKVRNHIGKIDDIDSWNYLANLCIKDLSARGDTHSEELLNHIYNTVGNLQNHYCFTPEKAKKLIEPYSHLVALAEQGYQLRKSKNQNAVDEYLGRYYGTLAQHYGFCGPEHLKKTLEYCDLAQEAFGGGNVQDLHPDWQRAFSYRFFAWSDAGDADQALQNLEKYLGCSLSSIEFEALDKYQHFHLCRYLADSGKDESVYVDWAEKVFLKNGDLIINGHPWQLWLLNLGKLVNNPEIKKVTWQKSLDICLNSYETMKIMGLMPLFMLYKNQLETEGFIEKAYQAIIGGCADSKLCREHFEPLWHIKWNEGLSLVGKEMARFFPFSYR